MQDRRHVYHCRLVTRKKAREVRPGSQRLVAGAVPTKQAVACQAPVGEAAHCTVLLDHLHAPPQFRQRESGDEKEEREEEVAEGTHCVQSSTRSPGTRLNSRTFADTNSAWCATAVAAIMRSLGPIN